MNKSASFRTIGRFQGARFMKPLAILLAILMLPPELPILGLFSFASKAKAQITVCGNQASIFQVCASPSNAFEVEAVSDYEKQYNLKPGDSNLIYTYGRTDLRMSLRAFMFDKLLAAILASPANRTGAEQGMLSYFQGVVQQHEIAQYTAAAADRDLFMQHLCQWVPDTDIEAAFGETVFISPYCGFSGAVPFEGLLNGPPDLPTIDYFIAKGYKIGYQQPLEAAAGGTAASHNLYPGGIAATLKLEQFQIAEMAALSSVSVIGTGVMVATRSIPALTKAILPRFIQSQVLKAKRLGADISKLEDLGEVAGKAVRIFGGVAVALEILTTALSVVLAILDAEGQQNEINTLNADLTNAKNNPPDLTAFEKDDTGLEKLRSVFMELTLPEFESPAALPVPGANDPQFVTNEGPITNHVGNITYQDQSNQIWTAQPYGQNWVLITGFDQNGNRVARFSNYLTYIGPDTNNNITAYKAWINEGNFMVAKLSPSSTDQICEAGPNGLYQGDTTNCVSFTPDHLAMRDVNGDTMNVTMSQAVVFDSPTPANVAFTAGVGGSITIRAHGIPAPTLTVYDVIPPQCVFGAFDNTTTPGVATRVFSCSPSAPATSFNFNLIVSNNASTVTVPFRVDIETHVHITSSTAFTITYGVPVNFVVTATGSEVKISVPASPWPEGITITDNGNGTASITGTPVVSTNIDGRCLTIGTSTCNVTASNAVSTDSSLLQLTILAPAASVTSPNQVTFRAGESNEFVITLDGGVTPAGINVYHVIDSCPSSDPSWLTKTQRPNGDLLLSGTPPFVLNNQTYNLAFSVPLVGSQNSASNCQFFGVPLTLTVASSPIFPTSQFFIALPGVPIPTNNFAMGTNFNALTFTGSLPAGVAFGAASSSFNFTGTVPVTTAQGDYKLTINATLTSNNNTASQPFDFIVGQPPTNQGFRTFNLVLNQPGNILINPSGFPKNAVGSLPAMTASFNINLPPGLQQQTGPMDGSIQVTGTPTQLSTLSGIFRASNGVAPDLAETIIIRVIKPGDINADGVTNCADVAMVQGAINTKLGLAGYNNLADVNGDGIVNAQDLLLVAKNLTPGTKCP
jgi:hypothetical protein